MRPRGELLEALFEDVKKAAEARRKDGGYRDKVLALLAFLRPHQRVLEADRSPLVMVRSARQTGKSTAAILLVTIRCLQRARAEWVVVGLTRSSVKRVYWGALQVLNTAYKLGLKFQHQELTCTFPNESKIYFVGAEDLGELEKLRGGRYHGAVVDEAKSYSAVVLRTLLEEVLSPALIGQAGQTIVIGTPGDILQGEFYEGSCETPVNRETDPEAPPLWSNKKAVQELPAGHRYVWSLHVWTLQHNDVLFEDPRTGHKFTLWDKALETKRMRGWQDDHPTWRREYLGQWVAGEGLAVYRYRPHLHDYVPRRTPKDPLGLGAPEGTVWKACAGVDFGTRDGTAVVVWAWSPTHPGLWELHSEKRRNADDLRLSVSDVAKWLREVEDLYGPFDIWVGDTAGLATMVCDSLATEHGIYVEPAEKREKVDHVEMFNNDLDAGLIHLRKGSPLSLEMPGNRWLEKTIGTDRRKENPSTPNDLSDAALYAYRWARHRFSKPASAPVMPQSEAWWERWAREQMEIEAAKLRPSQDAAKLDGEWWTPNDRS